MKRKTLPKAQPAPKSARDAAAQGSRFTPCPSCGRLVHTATLNFHLDECLASGSAAAAEPGGQQPLEVPGSGPPPAEGPPAAAPAPRQPGKEPAAEEAAPPAPSSGAEWWKPAAEGKGAVATANCGKGSAARQLSAEELFAVAQVEIVPGFMPTELADQVGGREATQYVIQSGRHLLQE